MTEIDIAKKALANAQDAYAETQSPETLDFIQRTQADLNRLYGADTAIDEDQIRLFNEIMIRERGDSHEPLSRFRPVAKPDPNAEKLKQILEGRNSYARSNVRKSSPPDRCRRRLRVLVKPQGS
jgi:hypothetical protein